MLCKYVQWEPNCSMRTDRQTDRHRLTDGQGDRHDGANNRLQQLCERANRSTRISASLCIKFVPCNQIPILWHKQKLNLKRKVSDWSRFKCSLFQWRTQEFCSAGWGGSTNSVEFRGHREQGSEGGSPLVKGYRGSCNLVQEI